MRFNKNKAPRASPWSSGAVDKFYKRRDGISLIEIIVYVSLLSVFAVFIANFLMQIVNVYQTSRAEREVLSNARLILERVNKSILESSDVYWPTSRFNDDAGQLSLVDAATSTPNETLSYLDYWIDNGRLWMRQEGSAALPLSATSVKVSRFRLMRIVQAPKREAVKITLQVGYALPKFNGSIILNSTTALRGNY